MPDHGIIQAEQRVREMNRMTRQYAEQGRRYMQNMNAPPTRFEPMGHPQNSPSPSEARPEQHRDSRPANVHSNGVPRTSQPGLAPFGIESDKLLLMALIYLLIKENADIKLILALGYLLL